MINTITLMLSPVAANILLSDASVFDDAEELASTTLTTVVY